MPRQLVVCLDGTGNRFSLQPTNVLRTFRSLESDRSRLLAYYDQGVGTFGLRETLFEWQKVPARVLGLAFGWGLRRTVEGAYRFLAQSWEDGDEIFVFGFSRGAYAARALAAVMHAVGLVPAHSTHLFEYGWSMLLARDKRDDKPEFELQARFKKAFSRRVRIRYLGLYDTVKSVGWVYDPVIVPYTADNSSVDAVRHAVSIDERRCFFRQHLWAPSPSPRTDLKEVWFAGVHSDIGGGYRPEEAQLALVVQRWMLGEALTYGLRLDASRTRPQMQPAQNVSADFTAPMHDSMTAPWKLAEWVPRLVWTGPGNRRRWSIGAMPPLRDPRPRVIPPGSAVHHSVEQRLGADIGYAPSNLPPNRLVMHDAPEVARLLPGKKLVSRPDDGRSTAGDKAT
jgi:uncharacterized protein (DUF2235 family)